MISAPLESAPLGIYFLDRRFSEPAPLTSPNEIPSQGIYAILVQNESYTPRPFQLIYVGESDHLARSVTPQHESYGEWERQARGANLYVAFYNMAGTTRRQRKELEKLLIQDYNPPCNERMSDPNCSMLKPLLGR